MKKNIKKPETDVLNDGILKVPQEWVESLNDAREEQDMADDGWLGQRIFLDRIMEEILWEEKLREQNKK